MKTAVMNPPKRIPYPNEALPRQKLERFVENLLLAATSAAGIAILTFFFTVF